MSRALDEPRPSSFGVAPGDPETFAAAVVLLMLVAALMLGAALAGYLPARRASRLNPTIALRYD